MSRLLSLGKLAGLALFGGGVASATAINRFLAGIAAIVALTVVISLMVGLLLVVGLYATYRIAIYWGVDPFTALLSIYGLTLALTIVLIAVLVMRLKQLKSLPDMLLYAEAPVVGKVHDIAMSFVQGLKTPKRRASND